VNKPGRPHVWEACGRTDLASLRSNCHDDSKTANRLATGNKAPRRMLNALGVMTMLGISVDLLAAPPAKAHPPGNFTLTCKNLRLNATNFSKTAMLTADCKRKDRSTHFMALMNLNDFITNNHGRLQWRRRLGGGDFQESCVNDSLLLRGTFLATCLVGSVPPRFALPSDVDLNQNIINDDGDLKYIGDEQIIVNSRSSQASPLRVPAGDAK
jgi:CVNH domain